MAERDVRERDILIASNEYAYVQDLTKGDIVLYVGPTKISLSNTERLVDFKNERFLPVRGEEGASGVCPFLAASSTQYVVRIYGETGRTRIMRYSPATRSWWSR